jgi:hypothetical protein
MIADEKTRNLKTWPKAANALTNRLRRIAPNLAATGIQIDFVRDETKHRSRRIAIKAVRNGITSSESSTLFRDSTNPGAFRAASDGVHPPSDGLSRRVGTKECAADSRVSDDTDGTDDEFAPGMDEGLIIDADEGEAL